MEHYAKVQGLWHDADTPAATYSSKLELNLSSVQPALAGPNLPQQRINLADMHAKFGETVAKMAKDRNAESEAKGRFDHEGGKKGQADQLAAEPKITAKHDKRTFVCFVFHCGIVDWHLFAIL